MHARLESVARGGETAADGLNWHALCLREAGHQRALNIELCRGTMMLSQFHGSAAQLRPFGGVDCRLEVGLGPELSEPHVRRVVTVEAFDFPLAEVPQIRSRHIDTVTCRRDIADRSREAAEVRSLNSKFDGNNITHGMHGKELSVDVGKSAGEARQRLRDLVPAEGERIRHVVERSVLGEQGPNSS